MLAVTIDVQNKASKNSQIPHLEEVLSASVIKHFELAYETGWKFLKEYLQHIHGIEALSPKSAFRGAFSAGILPEKLYQELNQLADARNTTTHIYDQILAREIAQDIIKHQKSLEQLLQLCKIN